MHGERAAAGATRAGSRVLTLALAALTAGGCAPTRRPSKHAPPAVAARPAPPPPTPVRALRVAAGADLIDGPAASGLPGDYRLDNGEVAFVFAALGRTVGRTRGGGHLVDAALAGGEDALWALVFAPGAAYPRRMAVYDRMRLESRPGGAAALWVAGRDGAEPDLRVETTYVLAPGARYLEIESRVLNEGERTLADLTLGDTVFWGRTEPYADAVGALLAPVDLPDQIWMGAAGERTGYAYAAEAGRAFATHHVPGRSDSVLERVTLAPGADWTVVRYFAVGGRGDTSSAMDVLWPKLAAGHDAPGAATITVREHASVVKVAGARVELSTERGASAGVGLTDGKGEVTLLLPPGKYYAAAEAPGRAPAGETVVEVTSGRSVRVPATTSTLGRVEYAVREDGHPAVARLTVLPADVGVPPVLGPVWNAGGAGNVLYTKGAGLLPLPPGRWLVLATKGPEYDVSSATVDVRAGETTPLELELVRIAATPGYLAADLHLHCEGDEDSAVSLEDRLLSAAGEGLELVALANDDAVPGPLPDLAFVGLTGELAVVAAVEASTAAGQVLIVPVPSLDALPRTALLPPAEAVALWRARAPGAAVVLAHPRDPDGVMTALDYDPTSGKFGRGHAALDFDLFEVQSGKDDAATDRALADWFSLLNAGVIYTAIGTSEAHLVAGTEPGYGRTLIGVGDAPPATPDAAAAAIEALRLTRNAVVTNGPFVELRVGGAAPGALVKPGPPPAPAKTAPAPPAAPAAKGAKKPPPPPAKPRPAKLPKGAKGVEVTVTVSAAPWIDVKTVTLMERGVAVKEWTVAPRPDPVRLRETLVVPVTRDTWFAIVVRGDRPLDPVVGPAPGGAPVHPFAVTNPVFVDKDGNGRYDP
jgi:hypothetical protein